MKVIFDKSSIGWVLEALEIKLPKNVNQEDIVLITKDEIVIMPE